MKSRIGAVVVAAAIFGLAAMIPTWSDARMGRGGAGGTRGVCNGTGVGQQTQTGTKTCQRLRDGSCGNTNCPQGAPVAPPVTK